MLAGKQSVPEILVKSKFSSKSTIYSNSSVYSNYHIQTNDQMPHHSPSPSATTAAYSNHYDLKTFHEYRI